MLHVHDQDVAPPTPVHRHPPATPVGALLQRRPLIGILIIASIALGVLAAHNDSSVLLEIDRPIQSWVERHRTSFLDVVFRSFSRLGSNLVVFPAAAVIVVVTWRRCKWLAAAVAVAVLAKSPIEHILKLAVGRDRPSLEPLVDGIGPSHPSGHVLAAVTLWGLLPPVVAAFTHRRSWWWASVAVSAVLIGGISASRVYLGVHWTSDIVQGFVIGALYLVGVEVLFEWRHGDRMCRASRTQRDTT